VAVALARLIAQRGESVTSSGKHCSALSMSRANLAQELASAGNAITKAARKLESLGVLKMVDWGQGARTYIMCWDRVEKLELPSAPTRETIADMDLFPDSEPTPRTPADTAGHPRPRVLGKSSNSRESVDCGKRNTVGAEDPGCPPPRRQVIRFDRLTDAEVRRCDVEMIRDYYREAIDRKWWTKDPEYARKFLAIWWNSANAPDSYNAAALVVSRVKSKNWRRLSEAAWEWAGDVIRRANGYESRSERLVAGVED